MTLTITADQQFSSLEISETLTYALQSGAALAKVRYEHFREACARFEQKWGMSSEEFWLKFEAGETGDDADFFDWYAAKRGADLWEKRYRILTHVNV